MPIRVRGWEPSGESKEWERRTEHRQLIGDFLYSGGLARNFIRFLPCGIAADRSGERNFSVRDVYLHIGTLQRRIRMYLSSNVGGQARIARMGRACHTYPQR